jgi:DNA repair exonuclease SbcCD ATPase subunit
MDVARAISKDPKVANLRQLEGIIDLLDDVYSSPDKALSNEAARIQDQLMEVESQLRAGKTPINDNVLETELQKAEREYDKIRDEYNKFFYNPDDERAFADRRTKEHKAWRKEADAFEAKLEAAGQKFEELYRQETDRLAEKVKHGSADEMKKAVAKGQKQDDKIMQERSDLQKDNRGCD